MDPEVVADVNPAPVQEPTAAPAPDVETPEAKPAESKTFTQEEVDALIGKRLAREQRKWERERAVQAPQAPQAPVTPEQFASNEEYVEALAEQRAEQKLAEREQRKQQTEILNAYHDKEEEVRAK